MTHAARRATPDPESGPEQGRPSWASSEATRKRMRSQPQKSTKPEVRMRQALTRLGMRYRLQVRPVPTLRRRVDIAFIRARVAVDIRGCFWHACPTHGTRPKSNTEWWDEKLQKNVARDAETVAALSEQDWQTVVVWEHDDPEAAALLIQEIVRARINGQNGAAS